MFTKVLNTYTNIVHLLFVASLVTLIFIIYSFSKSQVEGSGKTIVSNFSTRDSIIKKAIDNTPSTIPQIRKLKDQYEITSSIKKTYLYMAQKYNAYEFAFTVVFTFCSIVSAMLAFLILKKGWDHTTDFYLKSSFVIFFFSTSLFGILPSVFNNTENTKNNLAKYNYYSGLQIDIYNLVEDNQHYIKDDSLHLLDRSISNLNVNIKENQDLYFGTSIDKVPRDIKPSL
ncbi:MAG: hypothetical protein V4604_01605 [Bacteroidota bacterium]